MKSLIFFLCCLTCVKMFAQTKDTLILNNGKLLTGIISQECLRGFEDLEVKIYGSTTIRQDNDSVLQVKNINVKDFIVQGVRYGNRLTPLGIETVKVIEEGKASLFRWVYNTVVMHTERHPSTSDYNMQLAKFNDHSRGVFVLLINDKAYIPHAKYLKKEFTNFFGDCSVLVEESTKKGFDFENILDIVKKYNACSQSKTH